MRFQDLDSATQGAGTLCLVRSWHRWRGNRAVPLKTAMDLRDVKAFLPWLGLLELGDADTVRARLAGTALLNVYGADLTGKNLKQITSPHRWPARNAHCRSLVSQPCGLIHRCAKPLPEGKCATYETVVLPLDVDASGSSRHLLYCIAPLPDNPPAGWLGRLRAPATVTRFEFVDIGCGIPAAA